MLTSLPIVVLGFASCGPGRDNNQVKTDILDIPTTWLNTNSIDAYYLVYADGDSMTGDGIMNGSLLLREQPVLEDGEIGVFHLNGKNYIKSIKTLTELLCL